MQPRQGRCTIGLEARTSANQQKGNVVQSVRIAFAELIDPDNLRVVQHAFAGQLAPESLTKRLARNANSPANQRLIRFSLSWASSLPSGSCDSE